MTQVNEQVLQELVTKVLQHVQTGWGGRVAPTVGKGAPPVISSAGAFAAPAATANRFGQFTSVNEAVEAAWIAQRALMRRSLAQRRMACEIIRQICRSQADQLGRMEYEETKLGHLPHKGPKLVLAADISLDADTITTECFSGDHGITLEEHGPWGVIGVVTPVTHSLPTLANNAINMIAAGNALVCNPHPSGKKVAAHGAKLFNQAIYEKLAIDNLICVITEPTIESAQEIFKHPRVPLLSITGGPAVVASAMRSGKRAICAGPGNPPVVVDTSADIENAARCVLEGASYDNNLLCISEKEVFVEAPVFDQFMDALAACGAYRLSPSQIQELTRACIVPGKDGGHPHVRKECVGAEPQVLAGKIGLTIPAECRLLFGQTSADDPLVQAEQMMPLMPVVRCDTFEQAVDFALEAEHGFGHTAVIHSRLVDHMTYMGKLTNTTIFVKNGPSLAGDSAGGEGYGTYSIACTTGEGLTTPQTFTRMRRCVMVDNLRII